MILSLYVSNFDFAIDNSAFLQRQYSFSEVRVWKVVKTFKHGRLHFFFGAKHLPERNLRCKSGEQGEGQANRTTNPAVFPSQWTLVVKMHCLDERWFFRQAKLFLANYDIYFVIKFEVMSFCIFFAFCEEIN